MAVFTPLSLDEVAQWLTDYDVGAPLDLKGIQSGIENSNFFLSTRHNDARAEYVLTIFEKLSAKELPFYLDLTAHLSAAGIPCPGPVKARSGSNFLPLKGKPAAIVKRLPGASHLQPTNDERRQVGAMLASMHLAGASFSGFQANPRGPHWWTETAPHVMPFLAAETRTLLQDELHFQASHRHDALPRGPIHADLFRDNVLFENADATSRLGGFIDFYFAGCDCLLFDVAVCVNDWCIDLGGNDGEAKGKLVADQVAAFLEAYAAVRPFTPAEKAAWPVMLRAGALRFWLSRLYDYHLPRQGELIVPHDPGHFERILHLRRNDTSPPWIR